ncbi:MAG TPA: hypothetical protein PKE29_15835 [Phycisphaerales bacterium]|nr:hypothetical protein [Phycisphaerales bacterium]
MNTPPPILRPRRARAFTLIEVMLAGALGVIVIFAAMSFFTALERAKKFQAQRMETNTEYATAHRVIQQALRTLLMQDQAAGRDDDLKKHIEDDIRGALDFADEPTEGAALTRFALQPDASARSPSGRPVQTLEVTIATPPIHAVSLRTDAQKQEAYDLREMMRLRMRRMDLNIWDSSRADSAALDARADADAASSMNAERDPNRSAARAERLRAASIGLAGSEASPDALSAAAQRDIEAPRAPGLRGVFEIRPDNDPRFNGANASGPALSLWWKQLPPEAGLLPTSENSSEGIADPQLLALARRSLEDAPQLKILSGLKDARWRVYRRRQFVDKMTATSARELPAYVEFSFETVNGRREDWLFEVAWSYGAEPGTIIASNDPLGAPLDSNDVMAQINAAVNNAINGQKPSASPVGTDPSVAGGKPVAGTGSNGLGGLGQGGRPVGGAPGAPLKTPANTTRAEIDAILRQFGF